MKTRFIFHASAIICLSVCVCLAAAEEPRFGRDALAADARQLLDAIESAHPDPYAACGGKIQFHRGFHQVLASIPTAGMSAAEFYRLLLPFVASVGDGHTAIRPPRNTQPTPSGFPVQLGIVEKCMYVCNGAVVDGVSLLGARLSGIEGVPFEELLNRQNRLRGIENIYGTMALLGRSLLTRENLAMLLPEWKESGFLRCEMILADGSKREFRVPLEGDPGLGSAIPQTRVHMPVLEKSDVSFTFLDAKKETALLVIKDMMAYREGCEQWLSEGLSEAPDFIRAAYAKLHQAEAPADVQQALAGIPSAAETFRDLGLAMKEARSRNLIVDLRGNTGGNGFMIRMLLYTLYGDKVMRVFNDGYAIARYSDLYFQVYTSTDLKHLNKGRPVPIARGDYDFQEEERYRRAGPAGLQSPEEIEAEIRKSPTFQAMYSSGRFGGIYTPPRVIVLSTPLTYSSGFNMMSALKGNGGVLVGTPSAQPGNNFGDSLIFQLSNTGIQGFIAFKQIVTYPDDAEKGRCLPMDYQLTYSKLASYGFDPNSEVLMALEIIQLEKGE